MPNSLSFSDWHESFTNFLKSASSLSMSSLDNLLLSCRYRGEKRALLSSVPEASLNNGLEKVTKKKESGIFYWTNVWGLIICLTNSTDFEFTLTKTESSKLYLLISSNKYRETFQGDPKVKLISHHKGNVSSDQTTQTRILHSHRRFSTNPTSTLPQCCFRLVDMKMMDDIYCRLTWLMNRRPVNHDVIYFPMKGNTDAIALFMTSDLVLVKV